MRLSQPQPKTRITSLVLALSLAVSLSSWPVQAAPHGKAPLAKNFLPPVAQINDTLSPTGPNADPAQAEDDQSLEAVAFSAVTTPGLKLSPRLKNLTASVNLTQGNPEFETLVSLQQKLDETDMKYLWEATVEKNPVIRFSLEKLATPVELQPKKSSQFLNKTLSTMINGAAMGMMMLPGGGMYQNMGIATISQAANNLVTGNNKPQTTPLTATEQIQLAGLIDELKASLVQNYQNYKKTLELLAQAHEVTTRNNNLYAKALASKNQVALMAAASAFYKATLNETDLRQKAMIYRLHLVRMAGAEAVDNLQLALFIQPSNPTDNDENAVLPASRAPQTALNPKPSLKITPPGKLPDDLPKALELAPGQAATSALPEPALTTSQDIETQIGPPVPLIPLVPMDESGGGPL